MGQLTVNVRSTIIICFHPPAPELFCGNVNENKYIGTEKLKMLRSDLNDYTGKYHKFP